MRFRCNDCGEKVEGEPRDSLVYCTSCGAEYMLIDNRIDSQVTISPARLLLAALAPMAISSLTVLTASYIVPQGEPIRRVALPAIATGSITAGIIAALVSEIV